MPKDEFPGVFVEEVSFRARPIEGVSTSVVAFVGFADVGPNIPTKITGFADYCVAFGERVTGYLHHAVRGFFENGGTCCYVFGLPSPKTKAKSTASKGRSVSSVGSSQKLHSADVAKLLALLEEVKDIANVCCPDEHAIPGMTGALANRCEARRDHIASMAARFGSDLSAAPPREAQSTYAAYYAPWVKVAGPKGSAAITVHPGGHIAGAIAANDARRGVYKAPTNIVIKGLVGLERNITAKQQDALNPRGVNVLRKFPERGIRICGGRTSSSDPGWKYVNIRRYFIYLEQSIDRGTQWVAFEPNSDQLWGNVRRTVEDFLFNEWKSGALQGDKPDKAYFVRCDRTTMTQNDLDNGRLVCLIGVAPVKPAEFVIIRIGQWTADHKT